MRHFLPQPRKLKLVTLLTTAFALSAAQAAQAQTQAQSFTTLNQVVEQSIMTHPEIQARYHDFRSALEGQSVARGGFRPQVNAQGWIGREFRDNMPGNSSNGNRNWNRPGWTLELRQMIYDGFRTRNNVKQLGFEKLARYYELISVIDRTAQETVRAYLDVLRYRQMESLARQNYTLHTRTLAQIRERVKSGVGRRVDLEQATGRVALAQSNWMTETSNLLDVQQRYRRLTGQMPVANMQPVEPAADHLPQAPKDFIPSLRANPEFLSKQALIQAARAGVDSARGNFSPTLEFRASTGRDRGAYDQSRHTQSSSAQLVASYNLYRGGADSARLRQTTAQRYAARDVRDYTCRNVLQELSISWNNQARLNEQIPFLREHLVATQKVRDGYQQQFQIGQRSLMDLLDTESELFEAQRALANAEFDQLESQYRWLSLSNQLLPTLALAQPHQEMPDEVAGLESDEDLLVLCDASVSDTSQLAPLQVQYAPDQLLAQPPRLVQPEVVGRAVLRGDDAFFDFDRADIKPQGQQVLDQVVAQARALQDLEIIIAIGHTDHTGSLEYNQRLSERRAESVKAYLVGQGIDARRIRTEGRGKTQPVASNATPEGRAQNRRVEIEIIGTRAGSAAPTGTRDNGNTTRSNGGSNAASGWR